MILINLAYTVALTAAFDSLSLIIKGSLFATILTIAGYIDIKTKTIPDYIHVLIILVGLININLVQSLIGLVIVPLPFFIMACIKENSIGGGDIKLMGACGFFLGVTGGIVGSVVGLVVAIIINVLYCRIKRKKEDTGFALAPYLGAGSCIIYFV
ncbi:prepilin peptidase [bacterium AH-315-G05]|nr:prepilin peptidase [bacterium AH-315-L21]MBN4069516.1 prepilin peptidase [bacterium AH-315-G05]